MRRLSPTLWLLIALVAAGLALLAVELGRGATREPGPKLANPCRLRAGDGGGFDATVQRIVLDGLDGAACRLHTTREELVLSFAPRTGARRRWDSHTIAVALRAGMLRAVDEAERRGDLPGPLAPLLRRIVASVPLDRLVREGIRLRSLLG